MPSVLQDIIDSVFQGGTRPGPVKVMRFSFVALIVTLLGLLALTRGNLHVLALLVLSGGLFASIEWFVAELIKIEAQQPRPQEPSSAKPLPATSKPKTS